MYRRLDNSWISRLFEWLLSMREATVVLVAMLLIVISLLGFSLEDKLNIQLEQNNKIIELLEKK